MVDWTVMMEWMMMMGWIVTMEWTVMMIRYNAGSCFVVLTYRNQ